MYIMQNPSSSSSVKEAFVKKWIEGLQTYNSCNKEMSIAERKDAIKLSADIAMASTNTTPQYSSSSSTALWRRSITSKHTVIKSKRCLKKMKKRVMRARKMKALPRRRRAVDDNTRLAMKKRIQILKGLIPGGQCMEDEETLIKETLDYMLALRVQVDVMRQLVTTATNVISSFGNTTT